MGVFELYITAAMVMEKVIAAATVSLLLVAGMSVLLSSSGSPSSIAPDQTTQLQATCTSSLGETCFTSGCSEWRKGAICSSTKQCVCPSGQCAYQGSCIAQEVLKSVPEPAPVCRPITKETCRVFGCSKKSNTVCSGFSIGFSSLPTMGQCMCKVGQCANDQDVCVDAPQFFKAPKLTKKQIVCPVLSAIWTAGFFKTDELGRVERLEVQKGIIDGLGAAKAVGFGFAQTTAGYRANDPDEQNYGMFPLTDAIKMLKANATIDPAGNERYLNIFGMIRNGDVLHQLGAAVRGGPGLLDPTCTGYPCAARFGRFFSQYANKDGELCTKEFGNVASNIYKNGYHGVAADKTLFKGVGGLTFREDAALAGFLIAFGKKRGGWPKSGDICLKLADAQWMEMEGTFPKNWVKPNYGWGGTEDLGPIFEVWRKMGVKGLSQGVLGVSAQYTITKMAESALGH